MIRISKETARPSSSSLYKLDSINTSPSGVVLLSAIQFPARPAGLFTVHLTPSLFASILIASTSQLAAALRVETCGGNSLSSSRPSICLSGKVSPTASILHILIDFALQRLQRRINRNRRRAGRMIGQKINFKMAPRQRVTR
jgi:hypothetical protein